MFGMKCVSVWNSVYVMFGIECVMRHITKLRIIKRRVRSKFKPQITAEQCRLVEGKGTYNAMHILRTVLQRVI